MPSKPIHRLPLGTSSSRSRDRAFSSIRSNISGEHRAPCSHPTRLSAAYLSRIRAPLLQDIDITLVNQLTLRLPRICTFDLELFRPTTARILARIDFAQTSAHILPFTASEALQPSKPQLQSPDMSLSVSCARLDFQVSAMAQICSSLSGNTGSGAGAHLLLPVEELMPGSHQGELSEEWRGEEIVDPSLWHALLALFRQTRTLHVHVALAADLERALRPPSAA